MPTIALAADDISELLNFRSVSASHQPSCRSADEDDDTKHESVNHKWPSRELLEDPPQPPNIFFLVTLDEQCQSQFMRPKILTYKLYRATDGATSFWRWEVVSKSRRSFVLKSGIIYGTRADAMQHAEAAIARLSLTGKMRAESKSDRDE